MTHVTTMSTTEHSDIELSTGILYADPFQRHWGSSARGTNWYSCPHTDTVYHVRLHDVQRAITGRA